MKEVHEIVEMLKHAVEAGLLELEEAKNFFRSLLEKKMKEAQESRSEDKPADQPEQPQA